MKSLRAGADATLKTSRPWWRKKRWLAAVVLLVAVATGGWFVLGVLYAKPRIVTDYRSRLEALVMESQNMPPGAANAWPEIQAAVAKFPGCMDRVKASDVWGGAEPVVDLKVLYGWEESADWKDASPAQVASGAAMYIACLREAGVFADLDRIAGMKYAARTIVDEPLLLSTLPEATGVRVLARVCAARMAVACEARDLTEWSSAARQAIGLANHISRQPTPIEHLVGLAIVNLIVTELRYSLMAVQNDPAWIEAGDAVMRTIHLGSSRVAYEGERIITHDVIQRVCTDDGGDDGRIIVTELTRFSSGDPNAPVSESERTWRHRPIGNFVGFTIPGRKANAQAIDEFFDLLKTVDTLPHEQRWDAIDRLESMVEETQPKRLMIAGIYLPAVRKFHESLYRTRCEVEGTRLMLAIERFKATHSRPPASLPELVPGFLAEVPIDPINGEPFGYRPVTSTASSIGAGYVVYSFGRDGEDDDAKIADDPGRALTERGTGHDYVFNRAKPAPGSHTPDTNLLR